MKKIISFVLVVVLLSALFPAMVITTNAVEYSPVIMQNFNGHTYAVYDIGMTWHEAKAYCESMGGYLATVTSQEEQNFIVNLIKNGNKSFYWLGATDEIIEGNWQWVTGEKWTYDNWSGTNPDNAGGIEDYLGILNIDISWDMMYYRGEWNDFSNPGSNESIDAFGFICEWDAAATARDMVILFSEEAIAQAASTTVTGGSIKINQTNMRDLQETAAKTKTSAEKTMTDAGIEIMREMNADIKYKTNETKKITITIEPSAANTTADNIRVETPDYAVSIPAAAIREGTKSGNMVITVELVETTASRGAFVGTDGESNARYYAANPGKEMKYVVKITPETKENIKYSFEPAAGDVNYQAVFRSDGTPVGGKYNPVNKMIETRIRYSDTYTVRENKKEFGDIANKSKAMQDAIGILASKGIINGTSQTTFSPDGTITRAEIAALIVRTLSRLDENADGKFDDVKRTDWYFGAVGSAKSYGIINGTSATTFEPRAAIRKEQIVAIAARTLRSEMKYKTPKDTDKYLSKFADRKDLPTWGLDDFALASMADLIVLRTDGRFNPTDTMTRGDAAIILYRLFMKIW